MAHRLPRYQAIAERWGVTVEAAEVAAVRDPHDFEALVADGARPTDARRDERAATTTAITTHEHGHGHHGHGHAARRGNARAVGIAALLTGGFMVAEVAGGLVSGSLALIADAGHMLTDFAALGMAWLAFRVARRPADAAAHLRLRPALGARGLRQRPGALRGRGWIVVEAAQRLDARTPVAGGLMLAVAAAGLAINLVAFRILSRGDRGNLNLRAALLHVVGDLLGSVGGDRRRARHPRHRLDADRPDPLGARRAPDPALGLAVVRDSAHILLEGTPAGFDAADDRRRPQRERCPGSPTCATCTPGRSPRRGRWSRSRR